MNRFPSNSKSKISILALSSFLDLKTLYEMELLNNMQTPLALDLKEFKYISPPHSDLIYGSKAVVKCVSCKQYMSILFSLKNEKNVFPFYIVT